ncbi:MAG: hypothetical protein QMB10_06645 [Halioglobus sp.]
MPETIEARPASTVVLLRDTANGLETLLLKRNKALVFAGGAWVFPGGSVDPEDFEVGTAASPKPRELPPLGRRMKSQVCRQGLKIWCC